MKKKTGGAHMFFFFFYNNPYIAIIGDIKKSKEHEDRKSVQTKLKKTLNEINEKYSEDISAKFMITLGDEFQGLLCDGVNTMNIIEEIQREMHPVEIRFGVGIGSITTDINSEMAIGADGPGYYKARQAIDFLKENEQKNKINASDLRIEADGDNEATIIMLNTILSLLAIIKNNWTGRQREIIWDMIKHNDGQAKSAERLKIAQSSVQRGLNGGSFYAYKEALDVISNTLKEIGRKDV
jgi:hypothetical protein